LTAQANKYKANIFDAVGNAKYLVYDEDGHGQPVICQNSCTVLQKNVGKGTQY